MVAAADLVRERPRLVGLAYRMLGSVTDAEDVVGDVLVEALGADEPDSPAAWLTTVTVRRALDLLRRRQRERRSYVGSWLPEPRVTAASELPAVAGEQQAELSIGFLRLAETLTPVQRAVIILRSLSYQHAEIATLLEISTAASRQHEHRARAKLGAQRAEIDHGPVLQRRAESQRLLTRFLAAARRGDLDRLITLLHDDVVGYSDGGGQVRAARNPIFGPEKVARMAVGIARRNPGAVASEIMINDRIGRAMTLAGTRHLLTIDVREGRIHRLYDIANPDKINITGSAAAAPRALTPAADSTR